MRVPSTVAAPLVGALLALAPWGGGGSPLAQESAQEPMPGLQVVPEDMGGGSTESFSLQPRPASPPGSPPDLNELRVGPPTGLSCKAHPVGELFRLSWRRPARVNRWAGISYEVQYRTSHRTGDVYHSDGTRTSIPVWHGPWSRGGSWFGSVADELEDDWRSSAQRTQARVRARSGLGPYSGWSGISCGSSRGLPRGSCPAPKGLQVDQLELGAATARVSWDRPATAPDGGYLLHLHQGGEDDVFLGSSAVSYSWEGLALGPRHVFDLYSICLVNGKTGRGPPVSIVLEAAPSEPEPPSVPLPLVVPSPVVQEPVLPPLPPPASQVGACPAPTGLRAVEAAPGEEVVTVSWNRPGTDPGDGYQLVWEASGGHLDSVALSGSAVDADLSLAIGSVYSIRLYSLCSDGSHGEAGPVLITVGPEPVLLRPSGLACSAVDSHGRFTLFWNKPSGVPAGEIVAYEFGARLGSGPWSSFEVSSRDLRASSGQNAPLSGGTWEFVVRAAANGLVSDWSDSVLCDLT